MFKCKEKIRNGERTIEWIDLFGPPRFVFNPNAKTITIRFYDYELKKKYDNIVLNYSDFTGKITTEDFYKSKQGSFSDNLDLFFSGLDEKTSNAQFVMQANMMPVYTTLEYILVTIGTTKGDLSYRFTIYSGDHETIVEEKQSLRNLIECFYKETGVKRPSEKKEKKPETEMEVVKALREYKKLLDDGIITEEQFNRKRDELMS